MRIALLTGEYPPQPGGVGDYTRRLALALVERGHDVAVITKYAGRLTVYEAHQRGQGWEQYSLKSRDSTPGLPWGWRCWSDCITALAALRPDVLHIQYQTGAYGMHPAINLLPWRLRGLPDHPGVVVTFHDVLEPYLFPKAGALRRWVTLRLARDADSVIVTNADDALALRDKRHTPGGAGYVRPDVIPIGSNIPVSPPPGYDRTAWRMQMGVQPTEKVVAYFGLLSRSKGVDILLEALRYLNDDSTQVHPMRLVLIGGAATAPQDRIYAAEISHQIEQSGLRDRVFRTGQVDATMVSAHLLAADCVALPFRDGASFRRGSLLAALTHGAAVVTTTPRRASAASGPHLIDGKNVLLVPPDDSIALATVLRRVTHDDALRMHVGSGARALGAHFKWEEIAQQHERVYARVIPPGLRPTC